MVAAHPSRGLLLTARDSERSLAGCSRSKAESLPDAALPAQPPRSQICPFSFLGYVDMLGVAYEAPTLATGYGAYLAQVEYALAQLLKRPQRWVTELSSYRIVFFFPQPLMREVLEKKSSLTKEEARDLIERCMKILYYRDARSFNRVSAWLGRAGTGELVCLLCASG